MGKTTSIVTTTKATSYTPCHTGNVPILSVPGKGTLYAGGTSRGLKTDGLAIVDLTGTYSLFSPIKAMNDAASAAFSNTIAALSYEKKEPWLRLPITDGDIPDITFDEWRVFANDVREMLSGGQSIVVFCIGGHGRTGTVVSILSHIILGPKIVTPNPVTWLRDVYCEEVVETEPQVNYVYDMCGLSDIPKADRPKAAKSFGSSVWTADKYKANNAWMACRSCKKAWYGSDQWSDDICDKCNSIGKRKSDFPALTVAEKNEIIGTKDTAKDTAKGDSGQSEIPFQNPTLTMPMGGQNISPKDTDSASGMPDPSKHVLDGKFIGVTDSSFSADNLNGYVTMRCPTCLKPWAASSTDFIGASCQKCYEDTQKYPLVRVACPRCAHLHLVHREEESTPCLSCIGTAATHPAGYHMPMERGLAMCGTCSCVIPKSELTNITIGGMDYLTCNKCLHAAKGTEF